MIYRHCDSFICLYAHENAVQKLCFDNHLGISSLCRRKRILLCQVELIRNLEDKDYQFKTILAEKLQMDGNTGLFQAYQKELGDKMIGR